MGYRKQHVVEIGEDDLYVTIKVKQCGNKIVTYEIYREGNVLAAEKPTKNFGPAQRTYQVIYLESGRVVHEHDKSLRDREIFNRGKERC